jgi:diguanylate cyclase (GGDEF)-like protein
LTKKKTTTRAPTTGKRATTKTASKRKAKPPKRSTVVAVIEPPNANRKRAVDVCTKLGYKVVTDEDPAKVIAKIRKRDDIEVAIVGTPGGEDAVAAAMNKVRQRPTVVAALAGPSTTAPERCEQAGADLFVTRPLDQDSVAAVLRAATQLVVARDRIAALEGTEAVLRERLQRYGESDSLTGFQHFDFFEKYLVTELKRAKRYEYPIAACLVAIDPWSKDDPEPSPEASRKLRTRVASAVSACVRDIDVPVDVAEDRFLMFLPYTDIAGAERVGRRVAKVVASYGSINDGGHRIQMSVSVGIAALRHGKPVSFAKLMRDAGAAVRAAQLKGGNQVVVRK